MSISDAIKKSTLKHSKIHLTTVHDLYAMTFDDDFTRTWTISPDCPVEGGPVTNHEVLCLLIDVAAEDRQALVLKQKKDTQNYFRVGLVGFPVFKNNPFEDTESRRIKIVW